MPLYNFNLLMMNRFIFNMRSETYDRFIREDNSDLSMCPPSIIALILAVKVDLDTEVSLAKEETDSLPTVLA